MPVSVTNGSRYFRFLCLSLKKIWNMWRLICFVLASLSAISCGLDQIGEGVRSDSDGVWKGPSLGKDYSDVCCVTAFEYPEGKDWRKEQDDTDVSLVMLAEGSPLLRMDVGEEWKVSSDPQRHRIENSHLYTDFTDGSTTVVRKDGILLCEWSGAEEVTALTETGGYLHTLSVPDAGEGFVYRIDGQPIVERQSGNLYQYFGKDEEGVCFFFSQQTVTVQGTEERYYHVSGGKVNRIEMTEGAEAVMDIKLHDGQVCILAAMQDRVALVCGDVMRPLPGTDPCQMISCAFVESEELAAVLKSTDDKGGITTRLMWFRDGLILNYRTSFQVASVWLDKDGYHLLINPSEGVQGHIASVGKKVLLPEGYAALSKTCMCRKDSTLYVGLSSSEGGPPLIWSERKTDTLRINGYISGLQ